MVTEPPSSRTTTRIRPAIAGLILVVVRELGGSVTTQGDGWSLGYGVVYLVGFALCVLGSVFVTRIRSVR